MTSMAGFHWKDAGLLASALVIGLTTSCTEQVARVAPGRYAAAFYATGVGITGDAVKVFPFEGNVVTIALPFCLSRPTFGSDGRSVYGANATCHLGVVQETGGLSKVEFNPTRLVPVPGTAPFRIWSFAFSARGNNLVIAAYRGDANGARCGVFEILLPTGVVKQVLSSDCSGRSFWDALSLSPEGDLAIATVGGNRDDRPHLELIDLVHATTKPISGEVQQGVWSPDGKWIAAFAYRNTRISLIDAGDFSKRTDLGSAPWIKPDWSPDSRYLLLWKYQLFRCGVFLDVDGPATLEMLDIKSGERSTIPGTECQVEQGSTGWVDTELVR